MPYRDMLLIFGDLNGGRIAAFMTVIGTAIEQHRAGRSRLLAVTTPRRSASLPDVPTFAELGFPELTAEEWYGILVPAGTPPSLIDHLHASLGTVSCMPDIREALSRMEQHPVEATPAEFAARLRSEQARWGTVVRNSGFTAEE